MSNRPLSCVVSVSGIRGVVGKTIDVDQVMALASAYGATIARAGAQSTQGGVVVVGRDSRPTGSLFAQAVAAGLRAVGCTVVDIGIVPTPTVPIMIRELQAAGGIQVSASHNNVEWNALKLFAGSGRNVDQAQLDRVLQAYNKSDSHYKLWNGVGGFRTRDDALTIHRDRVLSCVDVALIRQAKLKVVIDSVNGAGSAIAPDLLAALGCEVVPIHTRPDQIFPRDPEPTAANVRDTGAVVKAVGAALGFVQDPDADRLAIIDENGRYIGEEYSLVLCAAARLAAEKAAGRRDLMACTNLSTSRMLEDVAKLYDAKVLRSKVGEAHVVDAMQANNAVIGGEGNGGIIDPRVVWGRDSQIGMALVLEYVARSGKSLSQIISSIPAYAMHKEKIAMDRAGVTAAIERLRGHAVTRGAELITSDGVKFVWADRWVHVRASGTEPASRIISEAPTAQEASDLAAAVRSAMGAQVISGH
jgi:phosphomannomutase